VTALTVTQAAERLATSGRNIRRMIQAGQLRATAINSRLYLIEERDLERAKSRPGPGRPRRSNEISAATSSTDSARPRSI
jgi:excisionase family DNA binding protein